MERLDSTSNNRRITENDTIAIMSGKGGVGKTAVSINLGSAIAEQGYQVTLIDFDLNASNLALELGFLANDDSIHSLIKSGFQAEMMKTSTRLHENLRLLPGSIESSKFSGAESDIIREITEGFDGIKMFDTSPGASEMQKKVIEECNKVIVVVTPFESSFVDGMKTVRMAKESDTEVLGVLVNKKGLSSNEFSIDELEESIDEEILGSVRHADKITGMRDEGMPVIKTDPYSLVAQDFKQISGDLLGENFEKPSLVNRIKGRLNL